MTIRTLSEIKRADKSNWDLKFHRTLKDAGISGISLPKSDTVDRIIGRICGYGLVIMLAAGAIFTLHRPEPLAAIQPHVDSRPLWQRLGCEDWKPGLTRTFSFTATLDEHGNLVGAPVCHWYRDRAAKRTAL